MRAHTRDGVDTTTTGMVGRIQDDGNGGTIVSLLGKWVKARWQGDLQMFSGSIFNNSVHENSFKMQYLRLILFSTNLFVVKIIEH